MANPLVAQGVLNRLLGSVTWSAFPTLNVTASYLGREGIRLALQGDATTFINTMTGAVTSSEPYQVVEMRVMLLKTQALAGLYKAQYETATVLGDCTVRSDSALLPVYQFTNCAIRSVPNLEFDGSNADFPVIIGGYYQINSSLWP